MAFQATLELAQRELLLCENNFAESALNSKACHDALWSFFTQAPSSQLKILLHSADFLAAHCPRLLQLRDQFGHRIEIRQISESERSFDKGFIIADQQYFLQRHHHSSYRGEYGAESRTVALLQHDFDLLWEQASPPDGLQRLYL
ncbi:MULTISPECIES: DUF7931 domain-containing protein [Deefgea]|uniref:DUF7931 domain-containing protein n=1 Tax=Deefgea chitinilytica TaxID=570276 RepID=A0ABS2CAN7_9NEIS|nr:MULTISPECIES: hypothetical protein [Deefgea]MBM5571087.1 hypothetical protein [Deefgea chitinilytica]MBM9888317.1 hypothetical protein [Deefgea sp. CFH1-16]